MSTVRLLRPLELGLMFLAWLITFAGLATVAWVRSGQVGVLDLLPGGVLVVGYIVVYAYLVWQRWSGDQLLLPLVTILCGLGLIQVSRVAPSLLEKQVNWLAIAIALMFITAATPLPNAILMRYKYSAAVAGVGLVAIALVFGVDPNASGARLWIGIGGNYFQPSEILKVLLVVFLAGYLDDKRELISMGSYRIWRLSLPPLPYLGPLLAMWGLSVIILVGQRDLGAVMLLFGVFLAMLYIATSKSVYVWVGTILFLVAAYGGYHLFSVVQRRVDIWLNPWVDPQNTSFQLVQSLVALAAGGLLGTGLGRGHPDLIPAAFTDFPFAALSEELGLVGAVAILSIYALLAYRGFRVALRAETTFEQLLAAGLTTVVGLQALIIIGGNIRLIPLTGITLPFVSYGGSSLLANFILVGLLLRISRSRGRERKRLGEG